MPQKDLLDSIDYTFEERRALLLQKLKSPSNDPAKPYKRYPKTLMRYAGGKSLAVGLIAERLPKNTKRMISPFIGGGSLEIAISNELDIEVLGFDIFDLLVNCWNHILKNNKKLAKRLDEFEPTKENYYFQKEILKKHWKNESKLRSFELAAQYYFSTQCSYGPHFLGWPSSVYLNEDKYKKNIQKLRDFSCPKLTVECQSFEKVIPQYPKDVLYCDPPYYLEEGKMFVGMYPHRNFPIHHVGFEHEKLRDLLLSHKGKFILSYNDCDTIRDWYGDFNISTPKWQYTFGQGDTRIGINRKEKNDGSHVKKSHEVLIWN